jgi:hypothetical protein
VKLLAFHSLNPDWSLAVRIGVNWSGGLANRNRTGKPPRDDDRRSGAGVLTCDSECTVEVIVKPGAPVMTLCRA